VFDRSDRCFQCRSMSDGATQRCRKDATLIPVESFVPPEWPAGAFYSRTVQRQRPASQRLSSPPRTWLVLGCEGPGFRYVVLL